MKKGGLLVSILLVLTLFTILSVNAVYEPQTGKSDSLGINSPQMSDTLNGISSYTTNFLEEPSYNGFIVSFSDKPVLLYQKDLNIEVKPKNLLNLWGLLSKPDELTTYQNNLIKEHDSVKQRFSSDKIGADFYEIYNGLVLYITEEECDKLVQQGLVQACYKNYEVKVMLDESVPLIKADQVWKLKDFQDRNITGQGVTIAIIDTGIDSTHPDLDGGKVVQEHCYCYPDCCSNGQAEMHGQGSAMDDSGHGTHCASIATGTGEASNGIFKGVAPDAKIEAIKVLDSSGSGWDDDIILGIEKAVKDNVSIISMSLGASVINDCYDSALSQATDNAVDAGVTVIVAAGNEGSGYNTISAPGCAEKVITVGASDKQDQIAYFSSRGSTNDFRVKPDITAPGVSICAAKASQGKIGSDCYGHQGTYVSLSGTSMATPHVAGLVALIKQKYPSWTPQEIKQTTRNNVIDINEDILTQGYGRIDALTSVQSSKPPIARLDTSGIINGTIEILGYIYAENFSKYRLEYGQGINPTNWTLLIESETIPPNKILYTWNTNQTEDGLYTLRVTVQDNNDITSSDNSLILVVNNREFNCSSCFECSAFATISNSKIKLTKDLLGVHHGCIRISANYSSFDCDGHQISGYSIYEGIFLVPKVFAPPVFGVNISNCNLSTGEIGIYLWAAQNCTLSNNLIENFQEGIEIGMRSKGCVLQNNKIVNPNDFAIGPLIFVSGGQKTAYEQNIDVSNTVDGLPIYYYVDKPGIKIQNLNHAAGMIYCVNCTNATISNNSLIGNTGGIIIVGTDGAIIENNTIIGSKYACSGIQLGQCGYINLASNHNIIRKNLLIGNGFGVLAATDQVSPHTGNEISYNLIKSNNFGIFVMGSYQTLITRNNITDSLARGVDTGFSDLTNISENYIVNNRIGLHLYVQPSQPIFIQHNEIRDSSEWQASNSWYTNEPFITELSYNYQGNYWGRSEYPYFCEYGNQNASCINNWDSNRADVIDSCPYSQSYAPGHWPQSPVCPQQQAAVQGPIQLPSCYMAGRTCVDYSGKYYPYCVGNSIRSYLCLNNRCVLNDAIPMCPYNQKCINGTCVSQPTANSTQCGQYGGVCINAVSCPSGYAIADYSCQDVQDTVDATSESVTGSGIFDTVTQSSSEDLSQPQIQTICCMKTQIPIQPISITASAIKQFGETYNQVFTKILNFIKNLF